MNPKKRLPLRAGLGAAAAGAVLLIAGPASAHVTVNPSEAPGGGYAKLTFRVPTESDTASTTKLKVVFPTDPGFASVSLKPHPGWRAVVTRSGEDVSAVTWTARSTAAAIKPGQFDEFDISLGPLPDSGEVVFKALQSYSDGSVVRWIETPAAGQSDDVELEHPAPTLTLVAVDDDDSTASDGSADSDGSGDSKAPLILSIVGIALGAAALVNSQRLGRRRG
ncbi:MAG: YcnI family protein [Nocardioides sp.]|uniref:YcnI family copper-binding membrane protein n=1 Tax=Nocardioides sp. TaxID=35761 RepID=UPI0039E49D5E